MAMLEPPKQGETINGYRAKSVWMLLEAVLALDLGIPRQDVRTWVRSMGLSEFTRAYLGPFVSRIRNDIQRTHKIDYVDLVCDACSFVYVGPAEVSPVNCPFCPAELTERRIDLAKFEVGEKEG
jgi:hypothetical protein